MAFKLFDRVQETSTSTGTGDFTLSGAVTGFKTFASRYSTGDTLYYAIQEVSGGIPTGAWEIGLGTYSAANTLTRTTVMASSNSDAAVSFAAGVKQVFVTLTALQAGSVRERLTATKEYYVRTDGSDSNNGLANTSGSAFLTIQKAIDTVTKTIDCAGQTVNINVADGTYTGSNTLGAITGNGGVYIKGNSGTPGNVVISTTSANCFNALVYTKGGFWQIQDMALQTTTSGSCINVGYGATLYFTNLNFGATAGSHIQIDVGGHVRASGNYAISGGSSSNQHVVCYNNAVYHCRSRTITISGTPGFGGDFARAYGGSVIVIDGCTFSGTGATGIRYYAATNGVIDTNGGGATYLPGNSAGSTATGGQYA